MSQKFDIFRHPFSPHQSSSSRVMLKISMITIVEGFPLIGYFVGLILSVGSFYICKFSLKWGRTGGTGKICNLAAAAAVVTENWELNIQWWWYQATMVLHCNKSYIFQPTEFLNRNKEMSDSSLYLPRSLPPSLPPSLRIFLFFQ